MLRHRRLTVRLCVLAVLLLCLGFVSLTPSTRTALAAPCCSSCPIPPGQVEPTPQEYCTSQCGASSGTCYNSCLNSVYNCWARCVNCDGGSGGCGVSCSSDEHCMGYGTGSVCGFCIQGTCQ